MKQLLQKLITGKKLMVLLTIGLVSASVMAQMNGTYTINSGSAASSSNFQNWASFMQGLTGSTRDDGGPAFSGGVSGPVTVNVQSSMTTTKMIVFPAISGTSSTNTITINGGGNYLQWAGPYEVISFTGGDYFTIKSLVIQNTAASAAICVRFSGQSDYNTIDKCTMELSGIVSGSTSGNCYVAFANSQTALTSATTVTNGSYNTISNNLMRTTNTNSPGPSYAITNIGNTSTYSSTAQNNTISGNTIQNFYYVGIYSYYGNGDQILNNDISRANSTIGNVYTSQMFGVYCTYEYSTSRAVKVEGNNIHDYPFVGAGVGSGVTGTGYFLICQYVYGNSTYRASIANNTLKNVTANYIYTGYNIGCQYYDYTGNTFDNCTTGTGSSSYYNYGSLHSSPLNYRINNNTIKNCQGGYYWYGFQIQSPNSSSTIAEIKGNTITNSGRGYYYTYSIYLTSANNSQNYPVQVTGNTVSGNYFDYYYFYGVYISGTGYYNVSSNNISNNKPYSSGMGYYCYGMSVQSVYGAWINNNLMYNNIGYYVTYEIMTYNGYTGNYPMECSQNTLYHDGSTAGYPYHQYMGLYMMNYYVNTKMPVYGNIVQVTNTYYAYLLYAYNFNNPFAFDINYNSYWATNTSYLYWYTNSGYGQDFVSWKNTGIPGSSEYWGNPNWVSVGSDWRSQLFENQNNVPTSATAPYDYTGAARNIIMSDRGARENYMDIQAVSTNFSVPASVCSGYQVSGGTTITVKNLFAPDTAYNFYVAYSINGGSKIREKVTSKILYNNQATVTFTQGLQLNKVGNTRIAIFIDIPDDNRTNDSFIFNTIVKPAPGGGKFNFGSKPTWAIYQYGKPNDVTVVNQPVYYNINAPRAYNNGDYNIKWSMSATAETSGGIPVGGITPTNPTGGNDYELKFVTSNLALEDEMITIKVKVSDLTNGCDTTLIRYVLIYPTIVPDFVYPSKICDGDAVAFDNKSTVKSGNMEFMWDFGTGNPADQTEAPNPVFQFPAAGNYKVKLTAKTLPYGFPAWDSAVINVGPIPTVKFTKLNACEGKALSFTNQTTPSNSTYDWNFGDASAHSPAVNPTHTYAKAGAYTVTLKANLNGCISETSQRVYQFDKPKAAFSLVSGNCDNEPFQFANGSTIAGGLFGNNWDFNDGTVSTEDEPLHTFAGFGTKAVKLVVTSEFGCKDSITKNVVVKESPVASFVNDPACSLTPTTFTNTTPSVSGTNPIYSWNFGDGGTSSAMSPVHNWGSLGPKTVTLTVSLDNGCKSSTTKDLSVGVQPKANFDAQNVCAGNPVVFENNTAWAQGNISYSWDFGDNTTSTNSDPQKTYATNVTTTYNVTLKASIAGGCSDQITKQVTINEAPQTCDFDASPDYAFGYFGIKLTPKYPNGNLGSQTGVTYTWVFNGGGTETGSPVSYNFQEDGSYKVTMRARVDATGCECSKTIDVVMNRAAVKDLAAKGIAVYPNPSNGQFNIALTGEFGKNVVVTVTSVTGKVVKVWNGTNNGLLEMNAADLADGIYTVNVQSGDHNASTKITIAK